MLVVKPCATIDTWRQRYVPENRRAWGWGNDTLPRKRYTEEQIATILKEAETGIATVELCRKYGVSQNTFYKWKDKFGGMTVSGIRRLRQLEDENRRLKQILANLTLDNQALNAINAKNR